MCVQLFWCKRFQRNCRLHQQQPQGVRMQSLQCYQKILRKLLIAGHLCHNRWQRAHLWPQWTPQTLIELLKQHSSAPDVKLLSREQPTAIGNNVFASLAEPSGDRSVILYTSIKKMNEVPCNFRVITATNLRIRTMIDLITNSSPT